MPQAFNLENDNSLLIESDPEPETEEKLPLKVNRKKEKLHKKHSDDNIVPIKKINHKDHIDYDDEKCEVLRDGVEKLNDNGFLHNKQYSWNNTFKEYCGHY